jgi:hypothetical protein
MMADGMPMQAAQVARVQAGNRSKGRLESAIDPGSWDRSIQ